MIIAYQDIQPETLTQLIEHFVLREGTEYGDQDVTLEDKVAQVKQQLEDGSVVIVYSELHESVNIVPKQQVSVEQQGILS